MSRTKKTTPTTPKAPAEPKKTFREQVTENRGSKLHQSKK